MGDKGLELRGGAGSEGLPDAESPSGPIILTSGTCAGLIGSESLLSAASLFMTAVGVN